MGAAGTIRMPFLSWTSSAARNLAVLMCTILLCPANAIAGFDTASMARNLGISELRAGVMLHDVETSPLKPLFVHTESLDFSKWQNLNAEVLFDLPDNDMMRFLGSPRLGLAANLNFVGKESYARLSAVWHIPVFETGIFIEPMLGGTVHNGYLRNAPAGHRNLGCRFLFQYGVNVGYEFTESFSAMVSVEHSSHLWMCGVQTNDGVNRAGIRFGWKLN